MYIKNTTTRILGEYTAFENTTFENSVFCFIYQCIFDTVLAVALDDPKKPSPSASAE